MREFFSEIGQKKKVHVYRLISTNTIEEHVVDRAERKLYLDVSVNRGSTAESEALSKMDTQELLSALRFGAQAIMSSDDADAPLGDDAVRILIDRGDRGAAAPSDAGIADAQKLVRIVDAGGEGGAFFLFVLFAFLGFWIFCQQMLFVCVLCVFLPLLS